MMYSRTSGDKARQSFSYARCSEGLQLQWKHTELCYQLLGQGLAEQKCLFLLAGNCYCHDHLISIVHCFLLILISI